jgi:F-type H+-transporting ATPase subunit a
MRGSLVLSNLLLAADSPLGHVINGESVWSTISWVGEIGDVASLHEVMLVIGGVVLVLGLFFAASRIRTGSESQGNERYVTRGRLAQLVEVMVVYLRDEMIQPILGEKQTRRWLPFLFSIFFFILVLNLMGMLPLQDLHHFFGLHHFLLGGTATANINVTATLALFAFVAIQFHSFRELGIIGWLDHLTCGLLKGPKGLLLVVPIVFAVEFAGVFIKPVALAIRLFANMLGGHILLATIIMLPSMAQLGLEPGSGAWFGVSIATGAFAVALTVLELFVAFLQAFVFMFLTAVFISLMSHEEHEHEDHAVDEVIAEVAAVH